MARWFTGRARPSLHRPPRPGTPAPHYGRIGVPIGDRSRFGRQRLPDGEMRSRHSRCERPAYPDKALDHAQDGVELARRLDDPFSVAFSHVIASFLDQARGDGEATSEKANEAVSLATEKGFPYRVGFGKVMQGWGEAIGNPTRATTQGFRDRIEHHRAVGTDLFAPYFLTLLGDVALKANQADECIAALDEAETVLNRTGERWWESETHRLHGALLVAQGGNSAEAEGRFEKALAVARQSDAKSLELRAAVSLARLWQQREKRYEARELLAPLYNWFTEGFETADLKEAKALIDELS